MASFTKPLLLALALTLGSAAGAQDTPAPAEGAAQQGQQPANARQTYLLEKFTDWEARCETVAEGKDTCHLYQMLRESNGNPVAEMIVFGVAPRENAVAFLTIITPLSTLLPPGLAISIDDSKPIVLPFSFCIQIGCFVRVPMAADSVAAMKKGAKASIRIVPADAPDKPVDIPVSLSGFTAGFEAVNLANGVQQ